MSEEKAKLGRRALACTKVWRMLKGTVCFYPDPRVDGVRAVVVKGDGDMIRGESMICVETGITSYKWDPGDGWLPDMENSATQGNALKLIAEHNVRRSMFDALGDAYHKVGRGLSFPQALVELLEEAELGLGPDDLVNDIDPHGRDQQ